MNMPYHTLVLVMLLTSGPLAGLSGAGSIPERYAPVLKRNIFRQSFAKPAPPPAAKPVETAKSAPPPKPCYMLTGVIKYEYSFAAVFENKAAGNVRFVETGESVDESKVVTITATSVTIERNGEQREIDLGQTLTGEAPSTITYEPPATTSPASPPTSSAKPMSSMLEEIKERMRRRRQQQDQKLDRPPAPSSK